LTGEVPSALHRFLVIACCCLSLSINADVPPQSPHLLFPQINYSHTAHILFAQGCTGYAGRGGVHLEATAPISRRQFCGPPRYDRDLTKHSRFPREWGELFVVPTRFFFGFLGGILLTHVLEGQPGHESGLRVGDRVLSVDGVPVKSKEGFEERLNIVPPGDAFFVRIFRRVIIHFTFPPRRSP
jgi:hypothetical protein